MVDQQFYPIKLLSKQMLTKDIMELRFERPSGFGFLAGQFVQFKVPHAGEYVLRSYSISSTPGTKEYLEFCTKILLDGKASKFFCDISAGSIVQISAAKGVFLCAPNPGQQKIFIATGTGIAPTKPMVESVLSYGGLVNLLFGVRHETDIFWHEYFLDLAKRYKNFSYCLTLSQPGRGWSGAPGRVTAHVPGLISPGAEYYVCGSLPMVKDVRKILMDRGVSTKSIHWEIF